MSKKQKEITQNTTDKPSTPVRFHSFNKIIELAYPTSEKKKKPVSIIQKNKAL